MTEAERGLLFAEPKGSNGFAIAPSHTRDGRALLLINPHTSFFFRAEQHVTSAEGLNAYGAATWGQFFIYQGFNPRGPQAIRVLTARDDFTPQTLIDAAYDPYLTAFARLLPGLVAAWDRLPERDPGKARLAGPIRLLRRWDHRWSADSTATSLAVFWGEALWAPLAQDAVMSMWDYLAERATDAQRLTALQQAADRLTQDFGSWQVPWGEINRLQRNDGAIVQTFDDAKPSIAVPFTSAQWGSLASFGASVRQTPASPLPCRRK